MLSAPNFLHSLRVSAHVSLFTIPSGRRCKMARPLTTRQQQVYDFIHEKICHRGYGPTVREIGEFLAIKSPNGVICHLRALERKGMIKRVANKSRAIELTHRLPRDGAPGLSVYGEIDNIACNLFDAPQTLDVLNAAEHPERYLLQYHGDNLREWAINDGDILVIQHCTDGLTGCIELVRTRSGALELRPTRHTLPVAEPQPAATFSRGGVTNRIDNPAHRFATDACALSTDAVEASQADHEVVGIVVGIVRTLAVPQSMQSQRHSPASHLDFARSAVAMNADS